MAKKGRKHGHKRKGTSAKSKLAQAKRLITQAQKHC